MAETTSVGCLEAKEKMVMNDQWSSYSHRQNILAVKIFSPSKHDLDTKQAERTNNT